LATTEMSVTIQNGISGYIHTDVRFLISKMKELLNDPLKAFELGKGAKIAAEERFNIRRFTQDWLDTFRLVVQNQTNKKLRLEV